MAGFVQPHLIQAHASLIGAPHVKGYDPTDEMIKQEQLRGLRIRNNQALGAMPSTTVNPNVKNHPNSFFKEPDRVVIVNKPAHAGAFSFGMSSEPSEVIQRQRRRPISQISESSQEQMQQLQLQKLRRDLDADQVVESAERFGEHSPDAQWDPSNGGRWVRAYRPGEREAIAAEQTGVVKDYFDALSGQRNHENKLGEDLARNENAAKLYAINRITDQNAKPQIQNGANTKGAFESPIRSQFRELLKSALDRIRNPRNESPYGDYTIDASYIDNYNFGVPVSQIGVKGGVGTDDDYDEKDFDTAAGIF